MPVTVPNDAKVHTTVYDNFKGVDMTNDISNVWRRRSPDGKNMLPDISGRPYKRKGWKIEVPAEEFISVAGIAGAEFLPKRIHHFSLGGQDYMVFFTSIGLFYMSELSNGIHACELAHYNASGQIVTEQFPPETAGTAIDADPGRSFFFEGKGSAAFYVFVGTDVFRFDGEYFWEVEPYVPTILIACDKYGAGTTYEPINLMTRDRTVQYLCDGETTVFILPNGVKNNTAKVELMSLAGEWEEIQSSDATYGWSISQGAITFNTAPPVRVDGEDNMRITYTPDGGYVIRTVDEQTHEETVSIEQTATKDATVDGVAVLTLTQKRKRTVTYTLKIKNKKVKYSTSNGSWGSFSEGTKEKTPATLGLTSPTSIAEAYVLPVGGTLTSGSYSDELVYTPSDGSFDAGTSSVKTTNTLADTNKGGTIADVVKKAQKYYNKHKKLPYEKVTAKETQTRVTTKELVCTAYYTQYYTYSASSIVKNTITTENLEYVAGSGEYITHDASAFTACQRAFVYGSGRYNQVFFSSSPFAGYNSRVWYSMADDPTYVPDTNYIEAGGDDTHITGMMKVSGYVGIIKQGSATDASVYLAYPTSFDEDSTFAVTQSINGIGAVSEGAFNLLNAEPLFLSNEGIMGIEVSSEEVDRKVRNRSYYIDKKLRSEGNLASAISYVHNGMYYLAVNGHVYVLDGSQKNSWANEQTNFQYECYYLENVPVQCFASMGEHLYFMDFNGNLCRFKTDKDDEAYKDEYSVGDPTFIMSTAPTSSEDGLVYDISDFATEPELGDTILYGSSWYTVSEINEDDIIVTAGVGIDAVWSTISDDDGAVHFFKNLQKKGCVVSLLPEGNTGVKVFLKADENDPAYIGMAATEGGSLPYDYFIKKKVKKYKRLQIICENNYINEGFGIDQIIKSYTIGNYSKNRG